MLKLTRIGTEVFHNNTKLTIVAQASKGANKEVVKIAGLPGSNGQTWISLSKLKEGDNELFGLKKVERAASSYSLTAAEQSTIDSLQSQIDAIIDAAKARFIPKSKKLEDMTLEELQAYIQLRKAE